MSPAPTRLRDALAAYVATVVDTAAPLTPAQRDRLAVLLAPAAHTPGPRAPIPVTSAGTASLGFSAGARATRTACEPDAPAQRQHGPLRWPGFRATPEASS